MERSYGLMYSQRVLLRLAETGLPRQQAYEMVQRNAMRAWQERRSSHFRQARRTSRWKRANDS